MKSSRLIVGGVLFIGGGATLILLLVQVSNAAPILKLATMVAGATALIIAYGLGVAAAKLFLRQGAGYRGNQETLVSALLAVIVAYLIVYFRQESIAAIALIAVPTFALYCLLSWSTVLPLAHRRTREAIAGEPLAAGSRRGSVLSLVVGFTLGATVIAVEVLFLVPSQVSTDLVPAFARAVAESGWPVLNTLALATLIASGGCSLLLWLGVRAAWRMHYWELVAISFAAVTINIPWLSREYKNYLFRLSPGHDLNTYWLLEVGVAASAWALILLVLIRGVWFLGREQGRAVSSTPSPR